jgi:acyl-CoA thioesterase I
LSISTIFLLCIYAFGSDASADEIQIVALGTSCTVGKGVGKSYAFPAKLESMLRAAGENVRVINQGRDGDTTVNLLSRLNNAVPEGIDIVIYEYAYGNEQKAGIPKEETIANSEKIISQLLVRNIEVLLVIRGANQEQLNKRTKRFNKIIKKYDILYLPIEQPFSSLQSDRQHPSVKGHELIAAAMVSPVIQLISRVKARQQ